MSRTRLPINDVDARRWKRLNDELDASEVANTALLARVAIIEGLAVIANTAVPVITGTPTVLQTLTASNGTWSGPVSSYTYQWTRDGVDIGGATSGTYDLVIGDLAKLIRVKVTATNALGSAATATSAPTAAIAAAP